MDGFQQVWLGFSTAIVGLEREKRTTVWILVGCFSFLFILSVVGGDEVVGLGL